MSDESVGCSCGGFGCLSFILFVFIMWSLWFGLPTPWGVLNIDLLPPAIRIL